MVDVAALAVLGMTATLAGAQTTISFSFFSGPAQSPHKLGWFSGALLAVSCGKQNFIRAICALPAASICAAIH